MTDSVKPWDPALVRRWLDRRHAAARLDQAAADRQGDDALEDHDKAAGEEWVCRTLKDDDSTADQTAFAARLKHLIAQDDYPATGLNDEDRFERHVRTYLRKVAKMTKANEGFEKTLRHQ